MKSLFHTLSFKISILFLIVLLIFGASTIYISIRAANSYHHEVNQKVNDSLAFTTAEIIQPYVHNGELDESGIKDLVHSVMLINPVVEVYVLDSIGTILEYVAPNKVVKMDKVSVGPIRKFLNRPDKGSLIYGDDPRNPGEQKVFSAARLTDSSGFSGYIYIVLASQVSESISNSVLNSYILGISTRSLIIMLVSSIAVGLLIIWILTTNLRRISTGIRKFREGDLKSRINVKSNGELDQVAMTFNQMADTIESNIDALKGVDKLRKELITNISHDLKTPIASIKGYTETLAIKDTSLTEEERANYLKIIYNGSEKLEKLVDELFELSKLEAGQVVIHREPFSIIELIQDVANKYRLISERKGVSLDIIMSKDISMVNADIALIDRVLQNLIDNAIKFCKEGDSVTVEVNETKDHSIEIFVTDTGPGIPKSELPVIFDRYYKGDRSARSAEGTGLGLAIVKKILDLHGSVIHVKSQIRSGSQFYFTLPSG